MIKVQILIPCEHCDGEAYLPDRQAISSKGLPYTRYKPCPACDSSGKQTRWISLRELIDLLSDEAAKDSLEVDWLELARHKPVSQYRDSRDAAGIP